MNAIMPGAEPFFFKGNQTGVLLIHGFTASPQEVREMGKYLAGQGLTTLGVRLAGHGTSLDNLAKTHWLDWLYSLHDGYALLEHHCDNIFLAGFSTGGALSLLYSTEVELAGLITMSTPIDLPPRAIYKIIYPMLRFIGPIMPPIPKGPPDWLDKQAIQDRVAYDAYDAQAVHQFGQLVRRVKPALAKVKAPILMMHSLSDTFIPVQHMHRIAEKLGSSHKEFFTVEKSGHVITCDLERQQVFQRAAEFIQNISTRRSD